MIGEQMTDTRNDKTVAEVIEWLAERDGRCPSESIACAMGRQQENDNDCEIIDDCRQCRAKWWRILAGMAEREKAEAVSAAMERTMAEQMREWAEDNGLPSFHDDESFKTWLDRCFLPRPLFESGEPVQFEDKVLHRETGETVEVFNMNLFSDGDFILGFRWDEAASSLYGKGERVKRPAPKVLDADGMPIKVGDTVWHISTGEKHTVEELTGDGGIYIDRSSLTWGGVMFTHKEPDTQECINADALKFTTQYWECAGYECDDCPSTVFGKTPDKKYGVGNCTDAMKLDLLRRQRELGARMGGE